MTMTKSMRPSRISRDKMLMEVAHVTSRRGTCTRAAVGAVVAREARPISAGYVGAPAGLADCFDVGCEISNHGGCTRTVHAEANAIGFASRHGTATDGATIYTTLAPCYDCAKLIINAGIKRVVYDESYRDSRGVGVLTQAGVTVDKFSDL